MLINGHGDAINLSTTIRKRNRILDVSTIHLNLYGSSSIRAEVMLDIVTRDHQDGNHEAVTKLSLTREKAVELAAALAELVSTPPGVSA